MLNLFKPTNLLFMQKNININFCIKYVRKNIDIIGPHNIYHVS
jgi:hypothetical protein